MKIALIHDYIKDFGGAEQMLLSLLEIWPDAPVYTLFYLPEFLGPHKDKFAKYDIRPILKLPFSDKLISPARLFPFLFESINLTNFDVVLVSQTGAYIPNLIVTRPETLHVCYTHTPPRFLYGYKTARNWQKYAFFRVLGNLTNHFLRPIDFAGSKRVDYFIANSENIAERIKKFYRRESKVIYPPVDISDQRPKTKDQRRYFLTGGRLARAKNIHLAIEACEKLNLPLKVFGKSFVDYGEELKNLAGKNTQFLGEVDDKTLWQLYTHAKALIFPAEDEDFGIIPVEAQACGTPVIAYFGGGVKETVIDGKTGLFFKKPTVSNLIQTIKQFNKLYPKIDWPKNCQENAKRFSKERFQKEIKGYISSLL